MAGFVTRVRNSWSQNNFSGFLKELQGLGIKDKREILKNSKTIGYGEEGALNQIGQTPGDLDDYGYLSVINNETNKYLPFYDHEYKQKREEFRRIANEPDIENILETLADECIVYDTTTNYFCSVHELKVGFKKREEYQKSLNRNFEKMYSLLNFNNPTGAWTLFIDFLIEGFICLEIVYDDKDENIIGFRGIDPVTIELTVLEDTLEQVWVQYKGDSIKERIIYDAQLIFISYVGAQNKQKNNKKFAYIERLIKPFNMLHTMEQTRSTWAIMNSSYRMKFIIPVGDKTKSQAKMTLASLMSTYNEELIYDWSTGQYMMNGKPHIPGMKQYWYPSREGEQPEMESVGGDGPEMNDTDILIYYRNKLENVSRIPVSRFRKGDGYETVSSMSDSITQEEAKFNRFVIRLRSIFQEILVKPIWIQTVLDHPELKDDFEFKNAVSLKFLKSNHFEQFKQIKYEGEILEHVERIAGLTDLDGEPFAPIEWIIRRLGLFTDEEVKELKKMKNETQEELSDNEYSPFGSYDEDEKGLEAMSDNVDNKTDDSDEVEEPTGDISSSNLDIEI